MSGLTPFGVTARKLRLEKGMRLLDLAARTKLSVAFLSAVETGKKPIPDGHVRAVGVAMDLTAEQLAELRRAADRTRKTVKIERLPEDQRELVAAFARRIDSVPADLMAKLKKVVLKSVSGEQPFQRKRRGIIVPPMSTPALRDFADKVRTAFVEDDHVEFPIMDVLEFRLGQVFDGFFIDVRDRESMGDDEGRVIGGTMGLALREDVYCGAWEGNGRDRFTACHELAHFLLHRTITMARTREDTDEIYRDAEWQADTFAGTLLMSPRHLPLFSDSEDAANQCGMTGFAAKVMWAKYRSEARFPSAAETPRFL
ncbi:ImmA/IrrE family metallo-endopeptidase [Bradyrhizobium sp. B124]|uniref:helix-turn-helix domain-containing protein n=1 Tax=Bradyrhizobium sp. B124 TaxID=3140245 RepID=UPI00318461CA